MKALFRSIYSFIKNGLVRKRLKKNFELVVEKAFIQRYPLLAQNNLTSKANNQQLLKYVLKDYFAAFNNNLAAYKRPSGKLPSQTKILDLIERVTGLNRYQSDFYQEMNNFLADDKQLQKKFQQFVPGADSPEKGIWPSIKNIFSKLQLAIKAQKKLRRFGKYASNFIADFGTVSCLVASFLVIYGVIVPGVVVAWPLMVAIIAGGVLYGVVGLAYSYFRDNDRRRNNRSLDVEIEACETKIELVKRLFKIHKHKDKLEHSEEKLFEESKKGGPVLEHKVKANIPASFYFRAGLGILGRVISSVSIGILIGMGIIWIASLAFPALPVIIPTLVLGGGLSVHYLYSSLKAEIKSINEEIDKYQEVEVRKQQLIEKFKNNPQVHTDLSSDNRTLLKRTLSEYLMYISHLGGEKAKGINGKYPKQEKLFNLIEQICGIKRTVDDEGRLAIKGDDLFYDKMANSLKGGSQDSVAANNLTQEFKNLFFDPSSPTPGLSAAKVNADNPLAHKKASFFKKVRGFVENPLFCLSVVSLAIALPLCLVGPQVIIVAPIAAVIFVGCLGSMIASKLSEKNKALLDNENSKLAIIDRKHKLINCNSKLLNFSRVKGVNFKQWQQAANIGKPPIEKEQTLQITTTQTLPQSLGYSLTKGCNEQTQGGNEGGSHFHP